MRFQISGEHALHLAIGNRFLFPLLITCFLFSLRLHKDPLGYSVIARLPHIGSKPQREFGFAEPVDAQQGLGRLSSQFEERDRIFIK